jgi:hypothetical protein
LLFSPPVKVELEGYLAAEDAIKLSSISHNKGVGLDANQVPSVVDFAVELIDAGVIHVGSVNANMRKPDMNKGNTVTQALLLQQAQGAALLEQQAHATKAAQEAAVEAQLLQQELRAQLDVMVREIANMGSQALHAPVPPVDDDSLGDLTEPNMDPNHAKIFFKEDLDSAIAEAKEEVKAFSLLRGRIPSHHVPHPDSEIPVPS